MTNDTLLRALAREPTDYTPIWLMRQAGRYLPEYNATRARAGSFLALAKSPALATEVTLQPLERFPLDAAILFSDILTVPDAMGLGLYFAEGEGPRFERPLRDEAAIRALAAPDPAVQLRYVIDAVRQIRQALAGRVPLIGFSGSPFTLACYMVEGSGSDDWRALKTMLYARPDLLHRILEVNARAVTDYLNAQIEAGAQAVMIFDTWGGQLEPRRLRDVLARVLAARDGGTEEAAGGPARAVDSLHQGRRRVARGDGGQRLRCDRAGLDDGSASQHGNRVGARVALQGNLDPSALFAPAERVRTEARRVLDAFGAAPGHVFNLGHGIAPQTPVDSVAALVEEVRTYSRKMRARAQTKA